MSKDYSKYTSLIVSKSDVGIAVVKFNLPDQLNAFSGSLHKQVEDVFIDLADDGDVKVIVVTGEGRAFSAGGNVKEMVERHGTEANWRRMSVGMHAIKRLVDNILACYKPVIAAVNGDALGLGATVALCCDVQVMSETARIGDTHVRVGLVAGDGGTVIWPLLLGPNRAKDFLMRARVVRGVEAERIGLVTYCAPEAEVMKKSMEIAEEICALPQMAVQLTKVAINKQLRAQANLMMDASAGYEYLTMLSQDHKEAAMAFVEKRKPSFKGY